MTDVMEELAKYGLDETTYEACLSDIRGKVTGENDMDWADIVEKYRLGIHSDTLRKASRTIFGGVFVRDYFETKEALGIGEAYLKQLQIEKDEIFKERQKLRDEKNEYARWKREEARDEYICEKIADAIQALQPLEVPKAIAYESTGTQDAILCFGDTHYGIEFSIKGLYGEVINEYNPEIFEDRMQILFSKVADVIKKNKLKRLTILSLGDEIDGMLRVSQLMKLRYGVVESSIRYADYISNWFNELSKLVHIDFYSTKGNHCDLRLLGEPKGTFKDENMTFVINEFIKIRLQHNPNFTFHENETGLIYFNAQGYNVLGMHGEVKDMENALYRFSNKYKAPIDILVGAHKHHYNAKTVGRYTEAISVPSVMGVDPFAMDIGKTSHPGALLFVVEQGEGLVEEKRFNLQNKR